MSTPAVTGLLRAYLQQRQTAGQTHIGLRPGMLARLQHFRRRAAARASEVRQLVEAEPVAPLRPPPPPPIAVIEETPKAPGVIDVPGSTKQEKLAALAQMAESAPEARALGTLRDTMVFAVGSPDAAVMFIGEAPGAEEERQREPFVGPAGEKLTGIIRAMGLSRADVYISNICKFRPHLENQGSSNRPPTPAEMKVCLPFILTEIDIIGPRVIVALGASAATGLGIVGPVTKLRGRFYDVAGVPAMVTFHPSYLLREEKLSGGGLAAKRQVWEDMLQVMEKARLPISDKQRGYFKK